MTSDSAIPNTKSTKAFSDGELISALSNLELNSTADMEENPVLPESEVKSVLIYLKSNSVVVNDIESNSVVSEDANPNFIDLEPNSVVFDLQSPSIIPEAEPSSTVLGIESNLVSEVESNHTPVDLNSSEPPQQENAVNQNIQIQIKSEGGRLLLILPTESQLSATESSWSDIWQQIKLRLLACQRSFSPNTNVHLVAQDRLLDGRLLQEFVETLNQFQLQLKFVSTSRRQTAIVAVTAGYSVEQIQLQKTLRSESKPVKPPLADPLYLEKTVRSGEEIRHPGHIILLGDLNPSGIVVADGDILVWGRLRGIAHAGASGNRECLIMALHMEPTQLRIADAVARAPEKTPTQLHPEVAYVTPQGIRIGKATDFSKTLFNRMNQQRDEG